MEWNRHNFEWGEWRKMRKTKQEQIISKEYE